MQQYSTTFKYLCHFQGYALSVMNPVLEMYIKGAQLFEEKTQKRCYVTYN